MYSQNEKYGFTRVQNQWYDLFRNKMYADVIIQVEVSTEYEGEKKNEKVFVSIPCVSGQGNEVIIGINPG